MRKCKICESEMILRLSKKEPYINKYFWGCSKYPTCYNIENTILEKIEVRNYNLKNNSTKSLLFKSNFILSDSERHYAINQHFNYDYSFTKSDLDTLDLLLGFENRDSFYLWIANQQTIVTPGVHDVLPVGSPYYFTFTNLIESLNKYYLNIITNLLFENKL